MMKMLDLVIVGGGMSVCIKLALRDSGLRIAVLDQQMPAKGEKKHPVESVL